MIVLYNTNIVVNPVYADTQFIQLCEGGVYAGIIFNADSLFVEELQTINGCDSIINTQIVVTPVDETTVEVNLCYNEEYEGVNYTENTTLYNTYTSTAQCDSFVVTNIFVHEEIVHNLSEQICEGETYEFGDSLYSETGTYTEIYTSVHGCDSIVTINLLVIDSYTSTINASICEGESYLINGVSQTTPGTYNDTLINNNGCPIILITNLSVYPHFENSISETICEGQSYYAGGALQTETGIYTDVLTTVNGCDSTIFTNLTVLPAYESLVSVNICEGESYFAGGANQTESGTYTDSYPSSNQCDSLVITTLIVMDNDETDVAYEMCEGDSILVQGVYYTEGGSYHETFNNQNGCDSVVNYLVEIINRSETYVEEVICDGDSIFLSGEYQTFEGEYVDYFTAASGCDSIITTMLYVDQSVELIAEDQQICFGEEIQLLVQGSNNVRWFPEDGLNCIDCIDPIASPNETTTYTITAESCMGTTTQTQITVTVNHPPSLTLTG